jgi:hypothetical protein
MLSLILYTLLLVVTTQLELKDQLHKELYTHQKSSLFFLTSIGSNAKILGEILQTGDGKSPETAYRIRTIQEEYQVLKFLGYKPEMQMLMILDDDLYDVFQVGEQLIYFKLLRKSIRTKAI